MYVYRGTRLLDQYLIRINTMITVHTKKEHFTNSLAITKYFWEVPSMLKVFLPKYFLNVQNLENVGFA